MKQPTIIIGLLGKGKNGKKAEGGLLEPEMEMPEALTDEAVNTENKANAVMKANYGPSEDKMRYCGNCEYFSTEYPNLGKGQGFCEVWEFKCSDKNLCAAYEFKKPEEEEYEMKGED
jgi:hypothetical protein